MLIYTRAHAKRLGLTILNDNSANIIIILYNSIIIILRYSDYIYGQHYSFRMACPTVPRPHNLPSLGLRISRFTRPLDPDARLTIKLVNACAFTAVKLR